MRSRTGLVALVIFVLAAAVACTSDTASRSSSPAADIGGASSPPTRPVPQPTPRVAEGVGAQFEQLLGQHALLAMRLARSEVTNASDFGQVAETSLEANTDALSQLVGTAYDDARATASSSCGRVRH